MKKVIIIGAGPSGVSAGLYTARSNIDTTVIYAGSGALKKAHTIENYYGIPKISGKDLFDTGIKQLETLGAKVYNEEVLSISYDKEFIVTTTENHYIADAILLATGAERNTPNIEGIRRFEGSGISYCAVCDGFFFRKKDVCVIGNSDYALHEAKELLPLANKVFVLTNGLDLDITQDIPENLQIISKPIKEIKGSSVVEKIIFDDDAELDISGVFIASGTASSSALAQKIGAFTKDNKIVVDNDLATSVKGVFASGDCVGGLLQISKAVSDGAVAATSIIKYLRQQEI